MPGYFQQGGSLGPQKAFGQRNKGVGVPAHVHSGGKGKATLTGSGRQLWGWCCANSLTSGGMRSLLIPAGVARPVDDPEPYAHCPSTREASFTNKAQ